MPDWSSIRRAFARPLVALTALAFGACGSDDPSPDAGLDVPPTPVEEFHDPLSRPEEPTLSVSDFRSATECAVCHPTHYEQWSQSMHAYAVHDPVFQALVKVRQEEFDGEEDQFCMQCHTAIGVRGGEIVDNFDFDELSQVVSEGVTCEGCHRVTDLERPFNSGHVIDPHAPIQGTLPDPIETEGHASVRTTLLEEPAFCGGCHDVLELDGLHLERPYAEWLESPAAAEGQNCQSCHMGTWTGQAAVQGEVREGLHDHRFIGVDLPLSDEFRQNPERLDALRDEVETLLSGSATLSLRAPQPFEVGNQLDVVIDVRNEIDAHALPTGTTFLRQLWISLRATDADGTLLYETGNLDDNGDLRDHWSELDAYGDDDLITLNSALLDVDGNPELFPWRATEHRSNAIPPAHERTWTLFVPTTDDVVPPITVEASLRFRTHPPYLLRAIGLPELITRVEVYDIASASIEVHPEPAP